MRYEIDAIRISHERLNDEVLVIDTASGAYYSGSGSFADLWSLLVQGAGAEEAGERLAEAYGRSREAIMPDVRDGIGHLLAKGLIREAPQLGPPAGLDLPEAARSDWQAPSLAEYTDMWDLIQLDPIHEVSDAGWPFAAPEQRS